MAPTPTPWATTVLLIDAHDGDRTCYAQGLMRCPADYVILEAADGQSGLDLYRQTPRIDYVVLELTLPDRSSFGLLMDIVPRPSRPNIAVVVLTNVRDKGRWDLARRAGAYACFLKQHTSFDDLDNAIQRAIAFVGQMPKEDRHQTI